MLMAGLGLGIVAGITGWCMLYVAGWLLILRYCFSDSTGTQNTSVPHAKYCREALSVRPVPDQGRG